jgi:hypothetical protein
MKRVFPTLAVLMAMMLVIWMIGCGDDEEEVEPSAVTETIPPAGGELAANGTLTIKFDNAPEAGSVTVNGTPATGSGVTYTWAGTGLTPGPATLTIAWNNSDGEAGAGSSVQLTITALDEEPPAIASSTPKDGATNLEPADLTADGITITFNDNMDTKKTKPLILIGDEEVGWAPKWNDDKTEVTLEAVAGKDIPHESDVTVDITGATDDAGNTADLSISFTTKGKE